MPFAIFNISNNGLNLVVTLLILMLVVVWLALIVYTYFDARRRVSDPFLVACATIASFIPYIGTAVYAILRPPEFLEDAHERELEKNYLRCPNCQHRLKDPCPSCGKPVDPRWAVCPYCENALEQRSRRRKPETRRLPQERAPRRSEGPPAATRSEDRPPKREKTARKKSSAPRTEPATRAADQEAPPSSTNRPKRSTSREPDPDPRQA